MAKLWNETYHSDETQKRNITPYEKDFLIELQKALNTQVMRQESPYYFVIRDYTYIYGSNLNNPNGICLIVKDDWNTIFEGEEPGIDVLVKAATDYYEAHDIAYSKEALLDIDDIYDLIDIFDIFTIMEYEEITKDSNMFLTQHAAQEYLKKNHYHFSEKAHTYCQTICCSDESPLFKILKEINLDNIPTSDNDPIVTSNNIPSTTSTDWTPSKPSKSDIDYLLQRRENLISAIKNTNDHIKKQTLKQQWTAIGRALDAAGYMPPEEDLDALISKMQ